MSSPSKPLSIHKPSSGNETVSQAAFSAVGTPALGTPDLRALRAGYAGTPPVPNIPPRIAAAVTGGASTPPFRPASSSSLATSTPQRFGQVVGGISATREHPQQFASPTPVSISDLDDLPIQDKVQVLERHLVPPELRMKPNGSNVESGDIANDSKSTAASIRSQPTSVLENAGDSSIHPEQLEPTQREGSEAFPITFDAPGADVT